MEKENIVLTGKEAEILRDLCFARNKVLQTDHAQSPEELPLRTVFSVKTARDTKPLFDFYSCVRCGNVEGLKHQKDARGDLSQETVEKMIVDYRQILNHLMQEKKYEPEDIRNLQNKLTGFIKAQKTASRILYIADCHFYHDRICREMDRRGFSGFEEMNRHMIDQWNKKVTSKDEVYILGDFSISKPDATVKILQELNGRLHLLIGNHDRYLEDRHYGWNTWFKSIEPYQEIRDNGRNVILSHYPVFCYKGQYRRDKEGRPLTYMLYGHVHNTHDEDLVNRFIMETRTTKAKSRHSTEPEEIPCNMINCFCMFSDYQPLTLDEWIVTDQKRRGRMEPAGMGLVCERNDV